MRASGKMDCRTDLEELSMMMGHSTRGALKKGLLSAIKLYSSKTATLTTEDKLDKIKPTDKVNSQHPIVLSRESSKMMYLMEELVKPIIQTRFLKGSLSTG